MDPCKDAFPSGMEILKEGGDPGLDDKYKALSKTLFGKGEAEDDMVKLVAELKEAIKKEGLVVPDSEHFHRKWLRASEKMDVNESVSILKEYMKQLLGNPIDLGGDVLPLKKLDRVYKQELDIIMPYRAQDGRRIMICCVGKWNPSKASIHELLLTFYALLELIALEPKTQVAGFELIFEGDGFGFSQFRNTTPTGMLNLIRCVQDRSPICVRGIHLINTPRLFNMVFNNMVKPFLNERIKDRIYTHAKNEELHKYISPEALPKKFGGKIEDFNNSECSASLYKFEEYFQDVNKMVLANKDKLK